MEATVIRIPIKEPERPGARVAHQHGAGRRVMPEAADHLRAARAQSAPGGGGIKRNFAAPALPATRQRRPTEASLTQARLPEDRRRAVALLPLDQTEKHAVKFHYHRELA